MSKTSKAFSVSVRLLNNPLHNKTTPQKDAQPCCDVDKSTSTILWKRDTNLMFENDYGGVHEERKKLGKKGELFCIKKSCQQQEEEQRKIIIHVESSLLLCFKMMLLSVAAFIMSMGEYMYVRGGDCTTKKTATSTQKLCCDAAKEIKAICTSSLLNETCVVIDR